LNLFLLPTRLINVGYALLEIYAGTNRAEDFITRTKHALEKLKLLRKQFIDSLVSFVLSIQEVDDHYVVLLSVAMTTANALLDPLRIPRQVVIHHQRTELKINSFGARFGRNHDPAF